MDPLSVAGLGLSAVSLTFQLFSGCVKGYQLLSEALDMPENFEHIRVRMRLEQIRFLTWGDMAGIMSDVLEEPGQVLRLHQKTIVGILLEIDQLFAACLKIERKFVITATSSSVRMDRDRLGTGASPYGRYTNKLLRRAMGVIRGSSEFPQRIKWAMIKQDRFEKLVEELISYNDSMLSLLDTTSLKQVHQTQVQSELAILQLSSKIEELINFTKAVEIRSLQYGSTASTNMQEQRYLVPLATEHPSNSGGYVRVARLAKFRASVLENERIRQDKNALKISINDIKINEKRSRIDTAMFRERAVWIEWKEFDYQNGNPLYEDILAIRVAKLAKLLSMQDPPREFRAPRCLGYIRQVDDDTINYGFIHDTPPNASITLPPKSLLELIRNGQSPSLGRRIRLASALASSLMCLHSVNWLHKGLRSENIIFFSKQEGDLDYTTPVISGFDYARPDDQGELTEKPESTPEHDIYRHPYSIEYPQASSQKSWDIYSLGIVLIEIAIWQSVNQIANVDFKDHKAKSKIRRVRQTLLEDRFLDRIGIACGDQYKEVVKRCLTGGVSVGVVPNGDETDAQVGSEMIRVFSHDIVDVLESIQV